MPEAKSWEEVLERFREIRFEERFDLVVAIANGGIIPAALLNQRLQADLQLLRIRLRDAGQRPMYDRPKLLEPVAFDFRGKSVLLVDDRVKTGSTLRMAVDLLQGARSVRTFAVNGTADYALFDEPCFRFPWIL